MSPWGRACRPLPHPARARRETRSATAVPRLLLACYSGTGSAAPLLLRLLRRPVPGLLLTCYSGTRSATPVKHWSPTSRRLGVSGQVSAKWILAAFRSGCQDGRRPVTGKGLGSRHTPLQCGKGTVFDRSDFATLSRPTTLRDSFRAEANRAVAVDYGNGLGLTDADVISRNRILREQFSHQVCARRSQDNLAADPGMSCRTAANKQG